jgi:uncharacterized membrane protein YkvA (DUF1232 family)
MRRLSDRLKRWARSLKRDALTLWLAARDTRTPWAAKVFCGAVAAYALSPIDLIPDFIPVLGWLDELILLPLAVAAVVRMIPPPLLAEFRREAELRAERPVSRAGAAVVVALWLLALAGICAVVFGAPAR